MEPKLPSDNSIQKGHTSPARLPPAASTTEPVQAASAVPLPPSRSAAAGHVKIPKSYSCSKIPAAAAGGGGAGGGAGVGLHPSQVSSSAPLPTTLTAPVPAAEPTPVQTCRMFADVSNIWSGIENSRVPLRVFLERIRTQKLCFFHSRIAFGSKTPAFAESKARWETDFDAEGWQVRAELRPIGGKESMVDDSLAGHMYRAILHNPGERIVVLSGDGNQRNHTEVSIFDAILSAIKHKTPVVLWCWIANVNQQYRHLQKAHPTLFSLNFLDDCVPKTLPVPPSPPIVPKPKVEPKMTSFTITLQSADNVKFPALSAPAVEQSIRDDLKDVPSATAGLVSTSGSAGSSKTDFVFVNFSSQVSAEEALKRYETRREVLLQGTRHAVKCAWKKECKKYIDSQQTKDLIDLSDTIAPRSDACVAVESNWLNKLLHPCDGAQLVPSTAAVHGSILSLYAKSGGGAAAFPPTLHSSSDSALHSSSDSALHSSSDSAPSASIDFGASDSHTASHLRETTELAHDDKQQAAGSQAALVDPPSDSLWSLNSVLRFFRGHGRDMTAQPPSILTNQPPSTSTTQSNRSEQNDSSSLTFDLPCGAPPLINTGSGSGSAKTPLSSAGLIHIKMDSKGS